MRAARALLSFLAACPFLLPCCLVPSAAAVAAQVDTALVLVTDVSRSIDDSEYKLEKSGYAAAFSDPRVISAIQGGPNGRIAVAYIEFSSIDSVETLIGFTEISDAASAHAFSDKLLALPRSSYGRTAISAGVDLAAKLLQEGEFGDARRVIDVAGDGTNNAGREITDARDDAVKAGITINGLTIINDHPANYIYAHVAPPGGLTNWYREHVTGGAGSFVLEVHDFATFGDAMTRKLLDEVAALPGHTG